MSVPNYANQAGPAASAAAEAPGWRNFFTANNSGTNQPSAADEAPIWMKYAAKGLGVFGGVVAGALGIWRCVTLSAVCLIAGILQIVAGFVVIMIEVPMCCFYFEFVNSASNMVNQRPLWQKALLYIILALPPLIFCASISTFLGTALIFTTGVIYGVMSLGRKASRSEMSANAKDSGLVSNMEMPMPTQPIP